MGEDDASLGMKMSLAAVAIATVVDTDLTAVVFDDPVAAVAAAVMLKKD